MVVWNEGDLHIDPGSWTGQWRFEPDLDSLLDC